MFLSVRASAVSYLMEENKTINETTLANISENQSVFKGRYLGSLGKKHVYLNPGKQT